MRGVGGSGFVLHTQIAVAEVVTGGDLLLVGSHAEEALGTSASMIKSWWVTYLYSFVP